MAELVELAIPTMPTPDKRSKLSPRLDTVDGKTVGVRVRWFRFGDFMDRFEELLRERYAPEGSIRLNYQTLSANGARPGSPRAEEFFQRADWAVLGLAA